MNEDEAALENIFLHLVRSGFRLGARDYADALDALRAGHGASSRENLLWLCQTLWARTEAERRFLDLLFGEFSRPTNDEIGELTGNIEFRSELTDETAPSQTSEVSRPESDARRSSSTPDSMFQFIAPTEKRGFGLPSAQIAPTFDEYFISTPRSVIPLRSLIVAWRRFRRVRREGAKTEFDLAATIERQSREGFLSAPVLVAPPRNQAALVIAVDASVSMTAWLSFNSVLIDSLGKGNLGAARVFYFHNAPDEIFYETETLNRPRTIAEIFKKDPNQSLLVISDAGASRGFKNSARIKETARFLSAVKKSCYRVAWLNPTPPARWRGTTAEAVSRMNGVSMFQLNEDGLIKAVDFLRGKRAN